MVPNSVYMARSWHPVLNIMFLRAIHVVQIFIRSSCYELHDSASPHCARDREPRDGQSLAWTDSGKDRPWHGQTSAWTDTCMDRLETDSPQHAPQVAQITGTNHCAWLICVFLVEMGFLHVGQVGFELLTS
ncbi:hypothetical protein AAY473_016434, partial [Plecturocebus cupreus]